MCFKSTISVISWQPAFIPDDVVVLCILTCHSVVLAHVFLVSLLKRVYVHNIWSLGFEKGEVKLSRAFWFDKIGNVSLSFLLVLHLQWLGDEKFQCFFSWRCDEEVRFNTCLLLRWKGWSHTHLHGVTLKNDYDQRH